MGVESEIGQYRYEGWDLGTKYAWMQQGQGSAAAVTSRTAMGKIAEALSGSHDVLHNAMGDLHAVWEGATATSASGAMACYADGAAQASQVGTAGAGTVEDYGGSFANLKPKIAAPTVEGKNSIWGAMVDHMGGVAQPLLSAMGVQSDYTQRVAANKAADHAANQALYEHEKQARAALAGFPVPDTTPTTPPGTGPAGPGPTGTNSTRGGVGHRRRGSRLGRQGRAGGWRRPVWWGRRRVVAGRRAY